jgi:hypothetical protein
MKIKKLNVEDIHFIMSNISYGSLLEICIIGKSLKQVEDEFISFIDKEFTGVFCDEDEKPMAMIVLRPTQLNTWCADLITVKDAWNVVGYQLTRFLKQFGDDLIKRSGGIIEAYSPFKFGKYYNWFIALGFELDKSYSKKVFRYVKQAR